MSLLCRLLDGVVPRKLDVVGVGREARGAVVVPLAPSGAGRFPSTRRARNTPLLDLGFRDSPPNVYAGELEARASSEYFRYFPQPVCG
jgi:hypothetical protein